MRRDRTRRSRIPALLLFAAVLIAPHARARAAGPTPWRDRGSGALLYRAGSGEGARWLPAPLLEMDVSIRVTGIVARTRVAQRFRNPTDLWLEGVYVFPLPPLAAVDTLRMRVGGRVIEGRIRERARARADYERAKREGRKASLVEQERPNLFTTALANLAPGEEAQVEIEYQEVVRHDAGSFELRFPMVAAPRYTPAREIAGGARDGAAFAVPTGTAGGFAEPALGHGRGHPLHPVRLRVTLDAGFALERVASPTHRVRVTRGEATRVHVDLDGGPVAADRDFVLSFTPARGREPRAALFSEEHDGAFYVLLVILPPDEGDAGVAPRRGLAREVVFVIDTSGSMGGQPIAQARAALLQALDRLEPRDRFNVIAFDTTPRALFSQSRRAEAHAVVLARHWVERLVANGGTEMLRALEQALAGEAFGASLRQVVFITDGAVSNETQLLAWLERHVGGSRLFPIGIGAAPNAFLLERAARLGRGTFAYIATPGEVAARMERLLAKIERPVLGDVALHWNDPVEQWPARIPDLYAGEPLVVTARVPRFVGDVTLTGRREGRPLELRLPLEPGAPARGIARLWARRKVAALALGAATGGDREAARREIVAVAARHEIVSEYTSLVAVDTTPERPASAPGAVSRLPRNLPHGWDPAAWPGVLPRTATPAPAVRALGALLLLAAGCARLAQRAGRLRSTSPGRRGRAQ